MKYLKTPKVKINNVDYTDTLKNKVLSIGDVITSIPIVTLPNKIINLSVRSPKYQTGNLYCNGDNVLFGKKYKNNQVILSNIQDNGGHWDIVDGQLYFKEELVNTDTDWKHICNCCNLTEYSELSENHIVYGIKDQDLYKLYQLKIVTPQPPIITERTLYAWTFDVTTVYTLTLNINFDTTVYEWDGTTLSNYGSVYNYTMEDEKVTDIYLATNTDNYHRDENADQTQIIETPQPDIITYEPRIEQIETEYKFKYITGNIDRTNTNKPYFMALGLTTENKLVTITRDGIITEFLDNVEYINNSCSEDSEMNTLVYTITGDVYLIEQQALDELAIEKTKINTYNKKCSIILPTGYKDGRYPLNNQLTIVDGNLYSKDTLLSNSGSWTQISTGYECGYGIDDGKLYKIYGIGNQWYNKKPTNSDITLIDDTMDWLYVYCNYNYAIAITSTGRVYTVRNNISYNKNINTGDWTIHSISHTDIINAGEESESKNITIPIELLNDLEM